MAKGSVTLGAGHFTPGTKVEIHERIGDTPGLDTRGKGVATAKNVKQDGEVEFNDLDAGKAYWITGEIEGLLAPKSVRVIAKADNPKAGPPQGVDRLRHTPEKDNPTPAKRVDEPTAGPDVVHGARSSVTGRSKSTNPGKKPKSDRSEGSQLDSRPQPDRADESTEPGKGPKKDKGEPANRRSDALPDSQAKKDDKWSGIKKLRRS